MKRHAFFILFFYTSIFSSPIEKEIRDIRKKTNQIIVSMKKSPQTFVYNQRVIKNSLKDVKCLLHELEQCKKKLGIHNKPKSLLSTHQSKFLHDWAFVAAQRGFVCQKCLLLHTYYAIDTDQSYEAWCAYPSIQ